MKPVYSIGILICLFILSCSKNKEIQTPTLPNNTNLTIIWKTPILDTNSQYGSMFPILAEGKIISSYYQPFSSEDEVVFALNADDGSSSWTFSDYIRESPQRVNGADRVHLVGNSLLASSSQDNYSLDISTGEINWATDIEDGNPRTSIYQNSLFHTVTYGSAPNGDSTKIINREIIQGDWKDVFQIKKIDQFEVHFEPPAVYINSTNDTLLIFQNRQVAITPFEERVDLYCYNMSADSVIWLKHNLTSSGSSNVRVPIIEGDLVYFAGKWDFVCIDILSGDIQWTHNFYYDFQGSNFIVYNDLIITNLDNGDLIAINKFTGTQEWVNVGLSGCCTELRIYGERLYFSNDKLYIVDPSDGKLLYKFKSPNLNGSFMTAISVDINEKRMYTSDRVFMMCFKLPD